MAKRTNETITLGSGKLYCVEVPADGKIPEDATIETHKGLIKKLYEVYETGDISTKDFMSLCETNEENSIINNVTGNVTGTIITVD